MHDPDIPAWRELSPLEQRLWRQFTLDCDGLDQGDCAVVSTEFARSMVRALDLVIREIGRFPSDVEVTILGRALVKHFNSIVIPEMRRRRSLH